MRKGLLVALCCAVVVVVAGIGVAITLHIVRNRSEGEAFSNERAYRNAVDHDYITDDFTENIAFDPTIDSSYEEIIKAAVNAFTILNTERAAQNLHPFKWDVNLAECAMLRAEEVSCLFENGHIRPDGTAWYTPNSEVLLGENIYRGGIEADTVMASWLNSEADKDNFMSDTFTRSAISIFANAKGDYYWVATFGSDLTDITFQNDVQPARVWILRDTESNRKTSVWGTAMIEAEQLKKRYHPGIPKSDDDKYLFRMIDTDGIYYEADIPELQDGWRLRVYPVANGADIHLEIFNEKNERVHDCDVFNAAL